MTAASFRPLVVIPVYNRSRIAVSRKDSVGITSPAIRQASPNPAINAASLFALLGDRERAAELCKRQDLGQRGTHQGHRQSPSQCLAPGAKTANARF